MKTRHILSGLIFFFFPLGDHAQESPGREAAVFYYKTGEVSSRGTLVEGKPDGYWENYYPDGTVKSKGSRRNFLLEGIWYFYNPDGTPAQSVTYEKGIKQGEEKIYENGVLLQLFTYKNGLRQGVSYEYYPDGKTKAENFYLNDQLFGRGYQFDPDGTVNTLYGYKDGRITSIQKINRRDSRGRKSGTWYDFDAKDKSIVLMQGDYKNGLRHGYFKYFDRDGNLIKTEKYVEDVLQNDAIETARIDVQRDFYADRRIKSYTSTRNGQKDGLQVFYDPQGNITQAAVFRQGILSEKGGVIDPEGRKQGTWVEYSPSGQKKAAGEYKDGNRTGDWTYYYPDGSVEQKGKYSQGKETGQWTWYYPGGKILRQEFYRNGKEEGESVEYDRQGNTVARGEYENGLRQGEWIFEVNRTLQEGTYLDGERDGLWKYTDQVSGKVVFQGEYRDGIPDGEQTYFYDNGKIKARGRFASGVPDGLWQYYNENGFVSLSVTYQGGVEVKYDGIKTIRAE